MNDIVTNYKGIFKFYYLKIIREIIKIGDLKNVNGNILDFGCGEKQLEKELNKKIFNYDLNPLYNELLNYNKFKYKIIVLNQVLMYMKKKEILNFFKVQKKKNKDVKFIVVISKHSLLTKFVRLLFNKKKLINISSTFEEQVNIIFSQTRLIKKKILFNNAYIFLLSF